MSNTENLPDEHFRDKLENMEVAPSDKVWSGISSHLERTAIAQRQHRVAWLWKLSGIALVLSLSAAAACMIYGDRGLAADANKTVAQNIAAPNVPAEYDAIAGNASSAFSNTIEGAANAASSGSNKQELEGSSSASSSHAVAGSGTRSRSISGSGSKQGHGGTTFSESQSSSSHSMNITSQPDASASGNMKITNDPGSNLKEGPKVIIEPDGFFNEGTKVAITSIRYAEPAKNSFVPEQEDPRASAKVMPLKSNYTIPPRMLSVKQRGIESELEELEYEEMLPEGESCPHWIAGVNYTYGVTYRKLKDNAPEKFNRYPYYFVDPSTLSKSYFDSVESKSTGYIQGLSLGYRAGRFTLKTGIEQSKFEWHAKMASGFLDTSAPEQTFVLTTATTYYSNDTLGDNYAAEIYVNQWGPSAPLQYQDSVEIVHTFNHTSVPLTLSYSFTKPCSKFGVSVTGGVAASFLKSYTLRQNGSVQPVAGNYISKSSYQLIAGASVSYSPVRWISIELQPTYRRFIQPVNRQQSVKTYPYMLGGQAGVYFRF